MDFKDGGFTVNVHFKSFMKVLLLSRMNESPSFVNAQLINILEVLPKQHMTRIGPTNVTA